MKKECEYCKKEFQPERATRKYCSDTCKQYAYLERHGMRRDSPALQGLSEQQKVIVIDRHTANDLNTVNDNNRHQEPERVNRAEGHTVLSIASITPTIPCINDDKPSVQQQAQPKAVIRRRKPIYLQMLLRCTEGSMFGNSLFSPERMSRLNRQQQEAVIWINERAKSYARTLLKIGKKSCSELREVQHLAKGFEDLINSYKFTQLTDMEYPCREEMFYWADTLKRYVTKLEANPQDSFKVILSREQQVDLKALIYCIGRSAADVDHGTPPARGVAYT